MPKLNLKTLIRSATQHYLIDQQPPALTESGVYGGLRVKCVNEPNYRFDPVGLVIPKELYRGYPEGIRISELLDPSSSFYDEGLGDFFSGIAPNALQEIQDIHDNICCNDSDHFAEKFEMELREFGVRFKIKGLKFPNDKPKKKGKSPRPIYPEHLNFVKLMAVNMGTNQGAAIKALGFSGGLYSKRRHEGGTINQNDKDLYAKWVEAKMPDVVPFLERNGCTFVARMDSGDEQELDLKVEVEVAMEDTPEVTEGATTPAPEVEEATPTVETEVTETDAPEVTEDATTPAPEVEETAPTVESEVAETDAPEVTEDATTPAPEVKEAAPTVEAEVAETDAPEATASTNAIPLADPKLIERLTQYLARRLTRGDSPETEPSSYIEKFLMNRIKELERENQKLRKAAMMLLSE